MGWRLDNFREAAKNNIAHLIHLGGSDAWPQNMLK